VMARDSIQLFLAAPRVGLDELGSALKNYVTGGEEVKAAMWQRGIDNGWVQLNRPRIAAPGTFETGFQPSTPEAAQQIGSVNRRTELMQALGDALHDFVPPGMRHLTNTPLHPLYFYTKQGERMRLFVGEAGYQKAASALADYRAAGANGDFQKLMGDSMARTFEPAVQNHFKDLVAAGQDNEAASFMARQLADATQFRYGTIENPELARSTFGRIGMQMGNFSTQFYQYLKESLRYGTWGDKAKFLSTLGGVSYALHAAKQATGWNFDKWQYFGALSFTGGPWIEALMNIREGLGAYGQAATGSVSNTGVSGDEQARSLGVGVAQALGMLNPLGGALRTYGGISQALQSPDVPQALGRLFVTGERGMNVGTDAWLAQHPLPAPAQMQPIQSPVSGARFGVPYTVPQATPQQAGQQALPEIGQTQNQALNADRFGAYDPNNILLAFRGHAGNLQRLAPDEQQYLRSLHGLPEDSAVARFQQYVQNKTQGHAPGGAFF